MKESFVFYRSFYNAISKIKNKELRADIYDAICELGLNESVQELEDSVGQIIMDLIRPQILANNERYANGKKGGRPKKEETQNHRFLNKKTIGFENEKPNVNVNDNENVNVNVNENDNDNEISADLFVVDKIETNADLFDFETETKTSADLFSFVQKAFGRTFNSIEYDYADLFSFVQKAFGRTFNSIEYDYIANWEDNELTRCAVKEAVLNNARSLKYVDTIIQAWKSKGFQTIAEVQAHEERRKKRKSNAVSADEIILEKFDAVQTKELTATSEEQAEMKKILEGLHGDNG